MVVRDLARHKNKTENHHLGYIIVPFFKNEYLRSGNEKSIHVLIMGANSLAYRFDEKVNCIRSNSCLLRKKTIELLIFIKIRWSQLILWERAYWNNNYRLNNLTLASNIHNGS